ncbi:hypothetical protein [Microcoleus sp. T3_A4]
MHITNRGICQGQIYFVTECDRPYRLTHSDKETWFFTESAGYNEVLS